MSKLMSFQSVRNRVHRSGFDVSYRSLFTAKAGELLPCFQQRILPGDKGEIEFKGFTRTLPVNTAAFTRFRQYVDFFFVPYRLLWDKWNQFAVDTRDKFFAQNSTSSAGSFSSAPYTTDLDIQQFLTNLASASYDSQSPVPSDPNYLDIAGQAKVVQSYKLIDSLGYGAIAQLVQSTPGVNPSWTASDNPFDFRIANKPTALDLMPFAAYQKIYMDYFRNSQWEVASPWTYNFDYVFNESQLHYDSSDLTTPTSPKFNNNPFTLRYANWKKDYFMGMLPNSQYGDVALAGPISGLSDAVLNGKLNSLVVTGSAVVSSGSGQPTRISVVNAGSPVDGAYDVTVNPQASTALPSGTNFRFPLSSSVGNDVSVGLSPSAFSNSGISVLQIRIAEALQKYKEIKESGSQDYRDQIIRHWGVTPSYDQSNLCRHIGGFSDDVNINEVINTNLTNNAEADLAGKGVGTQYGKLEYSFDEFGIILGIYHVEPMMDYASDIGLDRKNLAITQDNLPIPEFDSIGMQETYIGELIYSFQDSGNNPVFDTNPIGYAPRYAQWKTAIDKVHGGFSYGGFSNWVAPLSRELIRKFVYNPALSTAGITYPFFKIRPDVVNPLFVAQSDGRLDFTFSNDQFQCAIYYKHHKKSNLSFDGMPY